MTEAEKRLKFVEEKLPFLILKNNKDFKNHSIVKSIAKANSQLDGFMAAIYSLDLTLKDQNGR